MKKLKKNKKITAETFDRKFDRGEDVSNYLNLKEITVIKRVNIDFPEWMVKMLDREAHKLNISRQAVVKTWIKDRLTSHSR